MTKVLCLCESRLLFSTLDKVKLLQSAYWMTWLSDKSNAIVCDFYPTKATVVCDLFDIKSAFCFFCCHISGRRWHRSAWNLAWWYTSVSDVAPPFWGDGTTPRRSPKCQILCLNFDHFTANISKTVSRSVTCKLELNISSTRDFKKCIVWDPWVPSPNRPNICILRIFSALSTWKLYNILSVQDKGMLYANVAMWKELSKNV